MKQPTLNDLFPDIDPVPPMRWNYEEQDRDVIIFYSYVKTPREDGDEDEDGGENEGFDYGHENTSVNQPSISFDKLENVNLQSILNLIPEGLKPSDIKVSLNIETSCMAVEGAKIKFYYTKHFPSRLDLYEKHKAEYDKAYTVWEKENKKYQAWKKKQEIKELEDKLKRLKK